MPKPMRALCASAVLALLVCHPAPGGAQLQRAAPPKRPQLSRRTDPNDWNSYFDQGVEMLRDERAVSAGADAAEALRETVRREPYYAAARLLLGRALDLAGDANGPRAAYGEYLTRAPRADAAAIRAVWARLAVLGDGWKSGVYD